MCRTFGWEGESEISLEEYQKLIIEFEVTDVSSRDRLQLGRVDKALRPQRDSNSLHEDVAGKTLAIDHKIDEGTPYDADWYTEL